jgi:tetratricopeptide (TPR) repeat protein
MIRGKAEYGQGERQAIRTFQIAAETARARQLWPQFADAAMWVEAGLTYLAGSAEAGVGLLDEALAHSGEDPVGRSRLLGRLASALHRTGAFERAAVTTAKAIELARRVGDPEGVFDALICELLGVGARPLPSAEFPRRRQVLEELIAIAEDQHDEDMISHVSARALTGYLESGDYPGFEGVMEAYRSALARGQTMVHGWLMASAEAMRGIMVGDFAEAERRAEAALQMTESVDATLPAGVYGMQMFTIRREQGRLAEVAPLIKRFMDENPEEAAWRPGLMLIASDLGFEAQALKNLEMIASSEVAIPVDNKRLVTLTYIAEVAARLTGQPEHAERLYAQLLPFRDQVVTVPAATICCGAAARYLGQLAGALGDWSAAEEHFEYALTMNERMHARPWLAHTQHDYAVMLTARGRKKDQERAMALTAQAAETAQALNMSALMVRITGAGSRPSN